MSYNSKYKSSEIEEILDSVEGKADDTSVVHKTGNETITGAKTFNSGVNFLGSGDSNAVTLSTNTRINVNGTNQTVLGFGSGSFYINHGNFNLLLRGKSTRPTYNGADMALYSDVSGKQDKESGKGLSTEDFTSALKAKLEGLSNYDDTTLANAISGLETRLNTLVSGDASTAIESFNEIIAFLDGVQDTQDLASIIASIEQQIAGKMDKVTLATVATSGSYNDLSNKPTIPSAVTESTVSGWGFTKNTGTYSKPSTGIPKSDLASAVQTSLGKADTALQSYTEQYKGTITGVSANGTSVATSGVANIPAASTSAYGVTKLSSATNSTSTSLAATASAVKAAYDLANSYKGTVTSVKINGTTKNPSSGVVDLGTVITSHQDISGKQDKLVSGTNIKTINGTSILGSGNITISGGGGSSSGSGAYSEVNHGTSDTTFALTPNTFHVWEEVSALTLTLGSETAGVANEFLFQFNSGSEPTTLTMSDDIKWTEELTIEPNRIYQVSILKGLASVLSWKVEPSIVFPITLEMGDNGDIGISLYSYLQSTYGEPTSGTTLNEEIINNYNGVTFETIEYATYMGFTGYWLNGYAPYKMSWVLLEDGYLQRVMPAQEN